MKDSPLQLAPVPQQIPPGGGGGGNLESRIAYLEATVPHLATKADIANLKVWIMGGVITAIIITFTGAIAILKLFF